MKQSKCAVIGGSRDGVIYDLTGFFVICADSGLENAKKAGITPDLFVGDGDSSEIPIGIESEIHPARKDYTDLHLAVLSALSRGFNDISIYFGTGGRFDHYFANVCLLELICDQGAVGRVIDRNNIITFIGPGKTDLYKNDGFSYISLMPLDGKLEGVTLTGFSYPLDNAVIYRNNPIAVSNCFSSDNAAVEIKSGRSLLIFSRD